MTLLVKDNWEKFPKEIELTSQGVSFYTWPKHGVTNYPLALDKQFAKNELYKFWCFHQGEKLSLKLPQNYIDSLLISSEIKDDDNQICNITNYNFTNYGGGKGLSVYNEFALTFDTFMEGSYEQKLANVFKENPIAFPSQKHIASTKVFGEVSERIPNKFNEIEETIIDAPLAYSNPQKNNNYGMFIFGNTNSEWRTELNRPSFHRVWFNNHYQFLFSMWQLVMLRNEPYNLRFQKLLQQTRNLTDNTANIAMVRYGDAIGGFIHTKGTVPWNQSSGRYKHWTDPEGVQLAWLIDANRWAKDAFDEWFNKFTGVDNFGQYDYADLEARNINTTVVNAIVAYNHNPSLPTISTAITAMAESCLNADWDRANDPLWHPLWINKYYEHKNLVDFDPNLNNKLIDLYEKNSDSSKLNIGLAFSSLIYRMTGDVNYLKRHFYLLKKFPHNLHKEAGTLYHNHGMGPWQLGDFHIPMQWPTFLKQLTNAGISDICEMEESGTYPLASGNNILIDKSSLNEDVMLRLQQSKINNESRVSFRAISIHPSHPLNTMSTLSIFTPTTIHSELALRDVSFERINQAIIRIPQSSISATNKLGIYAEGMNLLFHPINQNRLPEALAMRNMNTSDTTVNVNYKYNLNRSEGYLLPLINDDITLTVEGKIIIECANNKIINKKAGVIKLTIKNNKQQFANDIDGNICNNLGIYALREGFLLRKITLKKEDAPYYLNVYSSFSNESNEGNAVLKVQASDGFDKDIILFSKNKNHLYRIKETVSFP